MNKLEFIQPTSYGSSFSPAPKQSSLQALFQEKVSPKGVAELEEEDAFCWGERNTVPPAQALSQLISSSQEIREDDVLEYFNEAFPLSSPCQALSDLLRPNGPISLLSQRVVSLDIPEQKALFALCGLLLNCYEQICSPTVLDSSTLENFSEVEVPRINQLFAPLREVQCLQGKIAKQMVFQLSILLSQGGSFDDLEECIEEVKTYDNDLLLKLLMEKDFSPVFRAIQSIGNIGLGRHALISTLLSRLKQVPLNENRSLHALLSQPAFSRFKEDSANLRQGGSFGFCKTNWGSTKKV